MKLIIAGSRGLHPTVEQIQALVVAEGYTVTELVSGGAGGVDMCGEAWAKAYNVPIRLFMARWSDMGVLGVVRRRRPDGSYYNAAAGPQRNAAMADYADQALVLWDGVSAGSKSMMGEMKKRDKPCKVVVL